MITLRRSAERRHLRNAGRETWKSFDAENPADPLRLGFRSLVTLDEERVAPGMGLPIHAPKDSEVLTYLREGILAEEGASSGTFALQSGECRRSGARSGAGHRPVNRSPTEDAHAFQSAVRCERKDSRSRSEQKRFPVAGRRGVLRLIVSADGKDQSLRMDQDIRIYSALLDPGHHLIHELAPGRGAWIHVVKGRIQLVDHVLRAGDGASLVEEAAVSWTAQESSEILLFDLA